MLVAEVTLEVWQLFIALLVGGAIIVGLGLKLIDHGRKLRIANGHGNPASYAGVVSIVQEEKADRQREIDDLKDLVRGNAKQGQLLQSAVADNTRHIAVITATQSARGEWMKNLSKKVTAILNKMGGQEIERK